MSADAYRLLVLEGLRDLPEDALAEIAAYVWLVRKRVLTPKAFEEELYALQIRAELQQMRTHELEHLEAEVKADG